jgi:hypothetical protein
MTPPRRRWLAFPLRTLFVGVTALATLLGWLGWNWGIVRERQLLRQEIEATGAIFTLSMANGNIFINPARNPMPFPRNWMGDQRAAGILVPLTFTEDKVATIRKVFPEASVYAYPSPAASRPTQ